jgi:hypothetical protein
MLPTPPFIYLHYSYSLKPSAELPPWKDPETLDLSLLSFMAPVGIIATVVAAVRGTSKWLVVLFSITSLILLYVGVIDGVSV